MFGRKRMTENKFFARLFACIAVGLLWIVFHSDSLVAVLIRIWLQETF